MKKTNLFIRKYPLQEAELSTRTARKSYRQSVVDSVKKVINSFDYTAVKQGFYGGNSVSKY